MPKKPQFNTQMVPEVRGMLQQLSTDDLRTLSAELEYLIRAEHQRRQQPQTLVDSAETYTTTLPPALDKVHQGERKRAQMAPGEE